MANNGNTESERLLDAELHGIDEDVHTFKFRESVRCEDNIKLNIIIKETKEKTDSDMDLEDTSDESESPSKKAKIEFGSPKEEENQVQSYRDQQSFPKNDDSDEELIIPLPPLPKQPKHEKEEGEIVSDLSSNEDSPRRAGGFDVASLFIEKVPFSTSILAGSEELKDESEKIDDSGNNPDQHNKSANKSIEEEEDDIYNDLPIDVNISPSYYNDLLLEEIAAPSTTPPSEEKSVEQESGNKNNVTIQASEDSAAIEVQEKNKTDILELSSDELTVEEKNKNRKARKNSNDNSADSDDDAEKDNKKDNGDDRKEKSQLIVSDSDSAHESPRPKDKVRESSFLRYRDNESSEGKTASDSDYSSTSDEDKVPLPKETHKTYSFHKRGKKEDKKKRDEIDDDDDSDEAEVDHLEIVAPQQAGVREQKIKAKTKEIEPGLSEHVDRIKGDRSRSPRDEQNSKKRHDYDKKDKIDIAKAKKSTKHDESKLSKHESSRYDEYENPKEKEQSKVKSHVSTSRRTEIQEDEDLRTKLLKKRSRRDDDYYKDRYERDHRHGAEDHRHSADYYEPRERTRQPYYEKDYKGADKDYRTVEKDYKGSDKDYKASDKDYRTVEKDYKGSDKDYRTVEKDYKGSDKDYRTVEKDYKGIAKDKKGTDKEYKASDRNYRGTEKDHRITEKEYKGGDKDLKGIEREYRSKSYLRQKDDKYLEKIKHKHSKEPKKKDRKKEKDKFGSAKGDTNKKKRKSDSKIDVGKLKHGQVEVDSDSDSPVETESSSFKRKGRGAEDNVEMKLEKSDSDSEKDLEYDDISSASSEELSPPPSPVELKKPTYFPAIQGCRSVEEFTWLNRIEEGTYGVVYRARDRRTDDIVALKRLKMEKEREGFPITSLREINTLLKAQHPNIVTVREIVVGSNMDKIYIVMDYVEHDLKALMETMTQPFLVGEVKTLMIQLLRGVQHLHDSWILHRDIKASNLLLSHKGILKIGDFGLAREYGSPLKQYTPVVVTLWYRAPELLLGTKEYSTAVDMWSVGCVFVELLTMKPLFPAKTEIDLINRIFKELGTPSDKIWPGPPAYSELSLVKKMQFVDYPYNSLRQRFGASLTDKGFHLMNRFLTFDPKKRITGEEALKHEYFEEAPLPVDPSMFPTWPAKSELGHRAVRKRHMASPKAPEGGDAASQLAGDEGKGFHMPAPIKGTSMKGTGFSLKF